MRNIKLSIVGGLGLMMVGQLVAGQETILSFREPQAGGAPAATERAARPTRLLQKAAAQVHFESTAAWCRATPARLNQEDFTVLELPGGGRSGEIGEPQLPCHGQFIEVPDGATVRLVVDDVKWVDLPGKFNVLPRQQPPTDKAGAPKPPFAKNRAAYNRDEFLPAQPVNITDQMRVRGKALVYVTYTPIACNPPRFALKAAREVRWHLEYDFPQGKPAIRRARPDPLGTQEFAPFFNQVLDGQPSAAAETIIPQVQATELSTTNGADYLIITHDNFYNNILPLAQWKHAKGYRTRVVKTSEISATPDCTNITAYISNAYSNWNPRPTYVLLVGDSAYIPAWYKTYHSSYGNNAGTDLYYAAIDGSDYIPDLFLGRLPCASTNECNLMVNKILTVEKTPDATASMYQTLLTSGEYTDSGGGYEERIFIETAEAVHDFYEAQGYTGLTSYCSDTPTTPRHYNADWSLIHTNGALYGGTQTYLSTAAGTAAISNAINAGVWLVQHRDHGSQYGGWATPPWSPARAAQLTNGTKLPVVMSINCETAWFDGSLDSLAETFLKNPTGGAYAVIGATRISYSWYNDWFTHGLYECMHTNYFEALSTLAAYKPNLTYDNNYAGHGTHLGQMLNFAKILMYEKLGNNNATHIEFDILTLLGDPEQSPRNAVPQPLDATHPSDLVRDVPADFDVTVTSGGLPVAGALVALALDPTEYYVTTSSVAGVAHFAFTPRTNGTMSVTASRQNYIPYEDTININHIALWLTLPASLTEGDGIVTGLVAAVPIPTNDLVVTFSSSDLSEILTPAPVTIFAGQSNTTFTISVVDDAQLDGTQAATITASGLGYVNGTATLAVHDNETATLGVTLPPSTIEGAATTNGMVTVSASVNANVIVGLSASDPTQLIVPASVTVLAGQTSAIFTATPVDDSQIDGTNTVTVTASVQNWTSGSALIAVADNENTKLTVTPTVMAYEGYGTLTNAGNVSIAGTLPAPLTVNLVSTDTSELTVPATVTIAAGQTNATFNVTIVDDPDYDGTQTAMVKATATGFVVGKRTMTIYDNDLHHLVWSAVSSPRTGGVPFTVTITAQDINSAAISNFPGPVTLTGTGDSGPELMVPAATGTFSNAAWTGSITVSNVNDNVRFIAADGFGHSGTSTTFRVVAGPLHHFTWNTVASPQTVNSPVSVSLVAQDTVNNTISNFASSVILGAFSGGGMVNVNNGATAWTFPMYTYYHDARSQTIYLASELGGPNRLTALSLYVKAVPGQTMNNWTIRLKHTALSAYSTALWETNDWSVVFQSNLTVSATGWVTFPFTAPFDYNGTSNLFVDFSFDNSSYTSNGNCWATTTAAKRSLCYYTDSEYGDPLTWYSTTPSGSLYASVPTIRLTGGLPVPVTPTNSGVFANGTWSGAIAVQQTGTNIYFRANDGSDHSGYCNFFDVTSIGNLTLTLPAAATEGNGILSNAGLVTVSFMPAADLTVTLASGDTTELLVPATVTIPAGQTNATFDITIVDDVVLDGPQTAIITAVAPGCRLVSTSMIVHDNENVVLGVTAPASAIEGVGTLANAGTVTVSAPVTNSVVVTLTSSDTSEVIVPANVTITAGQTSAMFPITVVDDAIIDGPQTVRITAHVQNWTDGVASLNVLDNDGSNLVVTPPSYDFGMVLTGTVVQTTFIVSNTVADILHGTASMSSGVFSIVTGSSFTVPGYGSTNVTVRFAPTSGSNYTSQVIFNSDGGHGTNIVTGTGEIPPTANFTLSPTNGVVPLTVAFTDTSTGTITNRYWNFGNGTTTNITSATTNRFFYSYLTPGTNTVTLIVSGPFGISTNRKANAVISTLGSINSWLTAADGNWTNAANWLLGQPSTNGQALVQITNNVSKTVTLDAAATNTPSALTVSNLLVSAPLGTTNTLVVSGIPSNQPLCIVGALNIRSNAVLLATNSSIRVDGSVPGSNLDGVITLYNSQVIATNSFINIGYAGAATVTITGGSAALRDPKIGLYASAVVTVNDSTLTVGTNLTGVGSLFIGPSSAPSQLIITNGGRVFNRYTYLGFQYNSASNLVLLTGSSSLWSNDYTYCGYNGSRNQLLINSGADLVDTDGYLGHAFTATGNAVTVTDSGSVWSNSASLYVGYMGASNQLYVLTGATTYASNLWIGFNTSSSNNLVAVLGGNLIVATSGGSGLLNILRGSLTVSNGTVFADTLVATNGLQSLVDFQSGALSLNNSLVNNDQPFIVGTGTGPATLQLRGGTHAFADGLILTTNATLTGTGTINNTLEMQPGSTLAVQLPGSTLTVNSNLTIAGTVNITDAGGFVPGTYTLITYTGSLTNNGLTIGTVPNAAYGYQLDTNVTGQVRLVILTQFANWQMTHFGITNGIAAPGANPTGDGLQNLIKYALGLDPNVASAYPIQFDREAIDTNTYLRLSVTRDPSVTDILIEGLSAGTLTNSNAWSTATTVIESNTPSFFRVRDAQPIETNSQRFLKLHFSLP